MRHSCSVASMTLGPRRLQSLILETHDAAAAHRGEAAEALPVGHPGGTFPRRRDGDDDVGIARDDRFGVDQRRRLGQIREHVARAAQRQRIAHEMPAADGIDRAVPDLQQHRGTPARAARAGAVSAPEGREAPLEALRGALAPPPACRPARRAAAARPAARRGARPAADREVCRGRRSWRAARDYHRRARRSPRRARGRPRAPCRSSPRPRCGARRAPPRARRNTRRWRSPASPAPAANSISVAPGARLTIRSGGATHLHRSAEVVRDGAGRGRRRRGRAGARPAPRASPGR